MAKAPETDSPKRKSKGANIVVWTLMVLLIAGLGGFGVTNYGSGVSAIGSVGDRPLKMTDYARALRAEATSMSGQIGKQLTVQEAISFGLDQKVRQTLITFAALDNENDRIGVSVGDARVATEVTSNAAFSGTAGKFDAETYKFTLQRNGLNEAEFENALRDEMARSLLQGAVTGGFAAPAPLTDTLYNFVAERRGLTILRLAEADLAAPLPEPTEAELTAFYDKNIARFTSPEAKRITYAVLLPETLAATMPVDETALRALYDERITDYVQPERRLVERLVYATEAEATAAKARLEAGTSFEDLVKERNLQLTDIDLGDVSKADLGAAGDAVFGLADPGVVGPFMSDLGPALFRMNGVLAAQEITFEEASKTLKVEFQQDAARRAIGDKVEAVDDALAGGATLEDLVKDHGMALGTIDFSEQSDEPIAGYPAFREAAAKLAEGDFPEAVLLGDGGLLAMRLDSIVPAAPIPFADASAAVTEAWHTDALAAALTARAAEIKTAVEGGAAMGSFGILSVTPEVARDGFIEDTPAALLSAAFKMQAGEIATITEGNFTALLRLDNVRAAEATGEAADALKPALKAQIEQALAQDAFILFANALSAKAGITLDSAAINAVHAQLQ